MRIANSSRHPAARDPLAEVPDGAHGARTEEPRFQNPRVVRGQRRIVRGKVRDGREYRGNPWPPQLFDRQNRAESYWMRNHEIGIADNRHRLIVAPAHMPAQEPQDALGAAARVHHLLYEFAIGGIDIRSNGVKPKPLGGDAFGVERLSSERHLMPASFQLKSNRQIWKEIAERTERGEKNTRQRTVYL